MHGAQCDTCRKFVSNLAPGWIVLQTCYAGDTQSMFIPVGAGTPVYSDVTGTFCSVKCLADWAYVAYMTEASCP